MQAVITIILLCFLNTTSVYAGICHPLMDANKTQYVVAYGSLMNTLSKQNTYPQTGPNLPVRVAGYARGWWAQGSKVGASTTFLGVVEDKQASFNGVVFHFYASQALTHYDAREMFYCRKKLPASQLTFLSEKPRVQGQYWIYVPIEVRETPSAKFPIVQSYVDIFLLGCLEMEDKFHLKGFAKECLYSTKDWSDFWVNDRIYPRRPFAFQPQAGRLDQLLNENMPGHFSKIKIE